MPLPHVILVPGLMCDSTVWEHQNRALRTLTTVEIPDHGMNDSLEGMAKSLLVRAPARFALAGHSMGGRVAFRVMRLAPDRVAGLALMDTAYAPRNAGEAGEQEKAERYALLDKARLEGMRAMGLLWVQKMVHPSRLSDKPLIDAILDMFARKTPEIFAAQIKALIERPDSTPVLAQIRCPTMVLCGRQDAWSPLAQHEYMAAAIPSGRLAVIENCGHMSTMERPEEVTEKLVEWLVGLKITDH
ncbi:MAG TPA: alpha/beta hydrolase [Terriglobia bacterium]|nr:alpha/beta hydrolase [Terriglobia bacterium]